MPYKGGVQLLPETQRRPTLRSYTSGNSYFYFAVFVGVLTLVVSAVLGGYKSSLIDQINKIDGTMATVDKARNKDQEKQLIAASKQSKIMKQLLSGKLYWSQALQRIEQMMQTGVALKSITANADKGTIEFQASADTLASVARQLSAFVSATGVSDIAVNTIQSEAAGSIRFSGILTIDKQAMLLKAVSTPTPTP